VATLRELHHRLHFEFEQKRRLHSHAPGEFEDKRRIRPRLTSPPRLVPPQVPPKLKPRRRPQTFSAALRDIRILDKMPAMTTMTEKETLSGWNRAAARMAKGLDFTDAEDRAIFRGRFAYQTTNLKVTTLISLAADWGQPIPANASRNTAVKAATAGWMIRRLKQQARKLARIRASGSELLAGERYRSVARSTGTTVVLVSCEEQGIPVSDGGRWAVICDEHGSLIQDDIQENLRQIMAEPQEWCQLCTLKVSEASA
jgi:hypothetical protein